MPLSHPFVERLIGTIRREYLDHVPFWNASDLRPKLSAFRDFYNGQRVHTTLGSVTPEIKAGERRPSSLSVGNRTAAACSTFRLQLD